MKCSRSSVRRKVHALPALRFERQQLTSFSGLVLLQVLIRRIGLKEGLRRCFAHVRPGAIYGVHQIVLQLVLHLFLGYRQLRDSRYYRDDPMVKRFLGQRRLPDVATVSRGLTDADPKSVENLRRLLRDMVLDRLKGLSLRRITLDFDGSVVSTTRSAEATAVGFNRKKKGERSYYPLFCTLAQTSQVFDVLHRPGNVHDSRGAQQFMKHCVEAIQQALPGVQVEARMDAAFFSDAIVETLNGLGVEFTLSVPFERFPKLKGLIQDRKRWYRVNRDLWCFQARWKPKVWKGDYRFLIIRTRARKQQKGPIQLDLFRPYEHGYEFKAIVTNKALQPGYVAAFHNGRGSQEGIFGELKDQCRMAYVPFRRWIANQIYLLASLLAHNLCREMQMIARDRDRTTMPKRTPLWQFQQVGTLRRNLLARAGRFTRPAGKLTLTISANHEVREELLELLGALRAAA